MRKIMYNLEIGFCGCNDEGEQEIPDGMTDKEIDDMVHDMALEHAQSWEGDSRLGFDDDMTEEETQEFTDSFYENVYGSWRWANLDEE